MAAYKRGDRWHYRFSCNGRQYSGSAGPDGRREDALALEAQARAAILATRLGTAPTAARHTIDEALLLWLQTDGASLRGRASLDSKIRHIMPHTAGRAIDQILDVAQELKKAGAAAGLSPATINRRLAILRRVANLAFDQWGWLSEPAGRRIKLLPGERPRDVFLSPRQVEQLASACTYTPAAIAIRLAARTGLREGELITASTIVDNCIVISAGHSKNGRARRVPVPADMPDLALPLPLTYDQLRTQFERARRAAELPNVRFHDLRHTAASWWIAAGASMVVVRDLLGHSTMAVTSRYSHLMTGDLQRGAQKVDEFLANGRTKLAQVDTTD